MFFEKNSTKSDTAPNSGRVEPSSLSLLKDKDQERIKLVSTSNVWRIRGKNFLAMNKDPYFLYRISGGLTEFTVSIQIKADKPGSMSALYFSYSQEMILSEECKYILGNADGQRYDRHFIFPLPVYWLRLDPVDCASSFTVSIINAQETDSLVPFSERIEMGSYSDLPVNSILQALDYRILEHGHKPKEAVVFVTHELSKTGAPLLCMKICEAVRKTGVIAIIVSLPMPGGVDTQLARQFYEVADSLFICRQMGDLAFIARELSNLGIQRVVLNTVVSGLALQQFHAAGFEAVCLIHEMRSSCRILHAEKWINDYSLYAKRVVFPAQSVLDDFMSFNSNVREKSVIIPQGYYKDKQFHMDSEIRKNTFERLGIPENAKLIIGAGSINFGKGVDLLALISLELQKIDAADYHFLWLGASNDEKYEIWMADQIERMGLTDKFHFAGFIADEKEYMGLLGSGNAFALVSREDSYPSVMIEAMSYNVPVVAFANSGGASDLLSDGRGYLVDYMDVNQFAHVLQTICTSPESTVELIRRAKEYTEKNSDFNEYVKRIMELFEQ